MSNPMLSSWYPTDPFLYPPTERIELFVIKKYTVSKMRGIGRNEPRDLPDIRPLFPNGCTDMLYRGRGRLDLVCLLGKPIKPWNPADPCLKLAAEIYYNEDDDISKFFTEQNRIAALDLAQALRRIESRRLACRAGCDFSFGICETACDEEANTEIAYHEKHYADRSEELRLGENEARTQNRNWFWIEAEKCGYTDMSLPKGPKGWGKEPQMPRLQQEY
jgi:hypothetical protein